MNVNKNAIANYASRLWSGLSTFIFIPIYLKILGDEAFGLITFSMTLLGIAFLIDMGISSAFAREVARGQSSWEVATLLRTLEKLYLLILILIIFLAVPISYLIAIYWLNTSSIDVSVIQRCIVLMIASSIIQVFMALYVGGLLGSNRHVAVAVFQIVFIIFRSGLVILPVLFFRNIEIFFIWQLLISLLFLIIVREILWEQFKSIRNNVKFNVSAISKIKNFAIGMFGITLISSINTHSDKIVISKYFTLSELGGYSIASLIGQIPSMLALPLAITILPRLTRYAAENKTTNLLKVFMYYSMLVSLIAFCSAGAIIALTPEILRIIGSSQPDVELVNATRLLTIGGALLAAQYMPYHLAIACGHTRSNLIIGGAMAATFPIALVLGVQSFGMIGAAWPWLLLNFICAVSLAWAIIPKFLGPHLIEWGLKANIMQFFINAVILCTVHYIININNYNLIERISSTLFGCLIAVIINVIYIIRYRKTFNYL